MISYLLLPLALLRSIHFISLPLFSFAYRGNSRDLLLYWKLWDVWIQIMKKTPALFCQCNHKIYTSREPHIQRTRPEKEECFYVLLKQHISYWNGISITATLEIKTNNLKCFLALGRNWANAQMPLEIKSRQKGKYSLVVQRGTDVHMFGNSHRSSFSTAQGQEPPADTAGGTQEDGYILHIPAGPCKNQSPLHPPLNATSLLF